jgi:hypothetical protein
VMAIRPVMRPPEWAYDAKFFKVKMSDDVMMKHQERAYTSLVWYTS